MHNNIKQANFSFAADFFPARASQKQIIMNVMAPHSSALTLYTSFFLLLIPVTWSRMQMAIKLPSWYLFQQLSSKCYKRRASTNEAQETHKLRTREEDEIILKSKDFRSLQIYWSPQYNWFNMR